MKKIIALLLVSIMVFSLCSCAKEEAPIEEIEEIQIEETPEPQPVASDFVSEYFVDPINSWTTYDDMLNEAASASDGNEHSRLLHTAEDTLLSTYCVLPLYYGSDTFLCKDYVSGIYSDCFAVKYFMYCVINKSTTSLHIGINSDPLSLDPAAVSSSDEANLAANCFSGLYTYDENGCLVSACAKDCKVSKDGLTYSITLKPNLKWSDGTDLKASDFVYSWIRAASMENGSLFSNFKGYDKGELRIKAVNDTTIEFVLNEPCAYMKELLTNPVFYPVCQSSVEGNPDNWALSSGFVSNGAFVCASWSHGSHIVYDANPYWYDADKVNIEKIKVTIADEKIAFTLYENGSLEFLDCFPESESASLSESGDLKSISTLETGFISVNCTSALFSDKTAEQSACMREAFSLLIDRDYICQRLAQQGQQVADSFIPPLMSDGNGGLFGSSGFIDPYAITDDFDNTIDEAVNLLSLAGFEFSDDNVLSDATPLSINYLVKDSSFSLRLAEYVLQDLAVIGIKTNIIPVSEEEYPEAVNSGDYDFMHSSIRAIYNDPVCMLEMWISDSESNFSRFGVR